MDQHTLVVPPRAVYKLNSSVMNIPAVDTLYSCSRVVLETLATRTYHMFKVLDASTKTLHSD